MSNGPLFFQLMSNVDESSPELRPIGYHSASVTLPQQHAPMHRGANPKQPMRLSTFVFILVSVAMSALAQIILKVGMRGADINPSLAAKRWGEAAWLVVTTPWVVLGLALYFLSAIVWLVVLSRVEVSFAYPFVGIGFILTMLMGWIAMGDSLSLSRVAGTLLIAGGVVLIARGG